MKKIILITGLFFTFFISSVYSFNSQGFQKIEEKDDGIYSVCEKQCFLSIGKLSNKDSLKIDGKFSGYGNIGYGFLIGKKIFPGEFLKFKGEKHIKYKFLFNKSRVFSQIPKDSELIFIFDGKLKLKQFKYKLIVNGFIDDLVLGWNDFWSMETLTPYSINLRYGVKILGISIVKYGYYIFLLFLIVSLFIKKYRKMDVYILLAISFYLFIGFRNLITYNYITKTGLNTFTYAEYNNKKFFDLGDYIIFTDKVLNKIDKNNCNIYMESFRDWPFKSHMVGFYLKPCNIVDKIGKADYAIFYKKNYSKNINGSMLVDYNNSYLLKLNK